MRRLHHHVDAELFPVPPRAADAAGESGVELRFRYNGELTYRRVWSSRDQAIAEASAKRAELERDGWMFHW